MESVSITISFKEHIVLRLFYLDMDSWRAKEFCYSSSSHNFTIEHLPSFDYSSHEKIMTEIEKILETDNDGHFVVSAVKQKVYAYQIVKRGSISNISPEQPVSALTKSLHALLLSKDVDTLYLTDKVFIMGKPVNEKVAREGFAFTEHCHTFLKISPATIVGLKERESFKPKAKKF